MMVVGDLDLQQGTKALVDAAAVVVSCVAPVEVSEEEASAGEEEPEVIGRKKAEDEEN